MIVCSCNLLTDKDIKSALASPSPPRCVREVYGALGCEAICGGCAGMIKKLMDAKAKHDCALDRKSKVEEKDAA